MANYAKRPKETSKSYIYLSALDFSQLRNTIVNQCLLLFRMRSSKSDFRQVHRPKSKEKRPKGEGKLQPIRNMLPKVSQLVTFFSWKLLWNVDILIEIIYMAMLSDYTYHLQLFCLLAISISRNMN